MDAENDRVGAERLTYFSDAVIAIALTLLALELPAPDLTDNGTNRNLLDAMSEHTWDYGAFLISFAVIAAHWMGHHRIFRRVDHLGGRLVLWNMLWLMTVVLVPFATKLLTGDGAFQVRFITYASVQVASGVACLLMVRDIDRYNLQRADTPKDMITNARWGFGLFTAAFAISIPLSFLTQWAYACWMALALAMPIRGRIVNRARRLSGQAKASEQAEQSPDSGQAMDANGPDNVETDRAAT